ncbi:MAG: hypothetical protein H0W73_18175 [Bacteroidetes bacterium]|nr:hypothetical protein [Bacteroidota bacterium]
MKLFYFEKNINFNHLKKITLYLESTQKIISSKQVSLYELIQGNSPHILNTAKEFYHNHYKVDIYNDYDIESLSLNDLENNYNWELKLVKKGSFEICLIEFEKLDPKHISFSA